MSIRWDENGEIPPPPWQEWPGGDGGGGSFFRGAAFGLLFTAAVALAGFFGWLVLTR